MITFNNHNRKLSCERCFQWRDALFRISSFSAKEPHYLFFLFWVPCQNIWMPVSFFFLNCIEAVWSNVIFPFPQLVFSEQHAHCLLMVWYGDWQNLYHRLVMCRELSSHIYLRLLWRSIYFFIRFWDSSLNQD